MSSKRLKSFLFFVIIFTLFIPIIQKKFSLVKMRELGGAVYKPQWESFNLEHFLSGSFQKNKEASLKADFGFNQWFIRLNNQIQFDCFGIVNANGVVFGKEGFLYEQGYIDAVLGLDFVGEDVIRAQVQKLKLVADSLSVYGTKVVVVLAPGKGSYYPEYMPLDYLELSEVNTNSGTYSRLLGEMNILTLDVNGWFKTMKRANSAKAPLFSKTGIHWSYFGENLVVDSLLSFLAVNTNHSFPKRELISEVTSKIPLKRDGDVWEGMNLLRRFDELQLLYPVFKRVKPELNKTKVLTISDSFYWGMFYDDLSRDYFGNGRFWYYYKEVFPESYTVPTAVNELDLKKELLSNDVVLLICTDANLNRFGFGFIDDAYSLFYK